jgi:hypothetical protein
MTPEGYSHLFIAVLMGAASINAANAQVALVSVADQTRLGPRLQFKQQRFGRHVAAESVAFTKLQSIVLSFCKPANDPHQGR